MLPTGFGKTDIFMFYQKLVQKKILVISPLKALVADQMKKYEKFAKSAYIDEMSEDNLTKS